MDKARIQVWKWYNLNSDKVEFFYGFAGSEVLGYGSIAFESVDENYLGNLVEMGDQLLSGVSDWRKTVPVVSEVPEDEVMKERHLKRHPNKDKFWQRGLDVEELERVVSYLGR